MNFKQARWNEPLIFERSRRGKVGHLPLQPDREEARIVGDTDSIIPKKLLREKDIDLPEVSEVEVVRHYTRLSQQNYGVDLGIYPLGSCTMKYTPKVCEAVAASSKIQDLHPYEDESLTQGILEVLYKLERYLAEITGMDKFSLQSSAGAHGELVGALIMRAYHKSKGQLETRTEVIVPDSAHGTNPASATMAGFKVIIVPSDKEGCVDTEALKAAVGERTAGLMLTNPNTIGVFEKNILEISKIVHSAGGLLYYDGANLNAVLGKTRPGDMGFDIVHVNIHKTFATPHGGGGPGAGPIGVVEKLADFLPVPTLGFDGAQYRLNYNNPLSIGKVRGFYGNINVMLKAYAYIISMGAEGFEEVAELSVLNANYLAKRILKAKGYELPYAPEKPRKHEFVISALRLNKETGVRALNISKRLLDYGMHAPTMYFPLIVEEALMVEPTETESKEDLDDFIEAMTRISEEAYENPEAVLEAPKNTTVARVDDVKASHPKSMCLTWRINR